MIIEEEVVAPVGSDSAAPVEAPSQTPAPEPTATPEPAADPATPADQPAPTPQEQTAVNQPELYELPDGRKVDGATLAHEWKNNFMPDYTRKSQIAAQVTKQPEPAAQPQQQPAPNSNPSSEAPWRDPNWTPNSIQDVIEAAKQEVYLDQAKQTFEQQQRMQQITAMVDEQLADIKKVEPNVSEDLLYAHATKYGFSDLRSAFKNMQDFNMTVKRTEQRVQQNLQNRAEDPIAVQTQQPSSGNEVDYHEIHNSQLTPADILRSLKGK